MQQQPEKTRGTFSALLDRQTFESYDLDERGKDMRPAYNQVLAVAEKRATGALLIGGSGNGKTHLARAAMTRFGLDRSYFWKVSDFLERVREECVRRGKTVEEVYGAYLVQDFLLVLDDLGVENPTDFAYEHLYRVLDARCDLELPTVITSNLRLKDIDARIRSRYRAGLVVCKGEDQR